MIIKKILVLLFLCLLMAACKKTYTCECTTTLGSITSKQSSQESTASKKEAETACKKNENLSGSPKVECTFIE